MDARWTVLATKIEKLGEELQAKIDTKMEELGTHLETRWTALETKIAKQGAELHAKIDARTEELVARMDAQAAAIGARIDAQAVQIASTRARIDDLRVVMLRVIWSLIILLAVPIFGELYKTLSAR